MIPPPSISVSLRKQEPKVAIDILDNPGFLRSQEHGKK